MKYIITIILLFNFYAFSQTVDKGIIAKKASIISFLENKSASSDISIDNISDIIDSISTIKEYSKDIAAQLSKDNLLDKRDKLKIIEKNQETVSAEKVKQNLNSYLKRSIIMEGIVTDLGKNGNIYTVNISNTVNCEFPADQKDALRTVNNGKKVFIRGILDSEGHTPVLRKCKFFTPRNLSADYANLITDTKNFVKTSLDILKNEVKQGYSQLVDNNYSKANEYYLQGDYIRALDWFNKVKEIDPTYKDIDQRIKITNKYILFRQTESRLELNSSDGDALKMMFSFAYPENFNNSRSLYQKYYTKSCTTASNEFQANQDITGFITLFESIKDKYSNTTDPYFTNLRQSLLRNFEDLVLKHYKMDLNKCIVIPGGTFLDDSKQKIKVESFLINQVLADQSLIKAYNIVFSDSIDKDFYRSLLSAEEKIGKWLGMKFINPDQLEYIKCDGWESVKEQDVFTVIESSKNYLTAPNEEYLVQNLAEIENTSFFQSLKNKENDIRMKTNHNISLMKEIAYIKGWVADNYYFNIVPNIAYENGLSLFSDPNLSKDSSTTFRQQGFSFSLQFGILLNERKNRKKIDDWERRLNTQAVILGLFYRYNYLPIIGELKINDPNTHNFQIQKSHMTVNEFGIYFTYPFSIFPIQLGCGYSFKTFKGDYIQQGSVESSNYLKSLNYPFIEGSMTLLYFKVSARIQVNDRKSNLYNSAQYNFGIQYPFWLWRKEPNLEFYSDR